MGLACGPAWAAAPTSLQLDSPVVAETLPVGAVVGNLSASDPDPNETLVFELVAGEGDAHNSWFSIQNRTLNLNSILDFESLGGDLQIRVRVRDSTSNALEQSFSLTLADNRAEDADGDGMSEAEEEDLHGTRDNAYDSDGDGFGDPFEIANGYLPTDAASHPAGARVLGWGDNSRGQVTIPEDLGDVLEIAAGEAHSLALRTDGTVVAWGNNDDGQCQIPAGLSGVVAIGAGDRHSLAVTAEGQLVAWGANESGQCTLPVGLANVVAVAGGGRHSLALKGDGTIAVWGADDFHQSDQPVNTVNVVAISAARDQCMVVFADGRVRSWGRNDFNQSLQPPNLALGVMGATGEKHSLMLRRDGFIAGWGAGADGQLSPPFGVHDAVAISARGRHNLAIRSDRSVVAWGANESGQSQAPFEARRAKRIAAGYQHSLMLRSNEGFPEISSPATASGLIGAAFSYQITVAHATPLSYAAMTLPAGLAIDPQTGLISGTLQNETLRAFRVIVRTDRGHLSRLVLLSFGDESVPTGIVVSPPTVLENAPLGSVVGTLSAIDADAGATHSFQLIEGPGDRENYRFLISGDQLLVRFGIDVDFEKPHQPFLLRVLATDSAGGSVQVPLTIEMLDDTTEDSDHDGLSEEDEELAHGTSDVNFDSDGDGIGDGVEVQAGRSPINPDDWPDDYPLVGWGANPDAALQPPFAGGVAALSTGSAMGLVLKTDGNLLAWSGKNTYGQRNIPANVGDVVAVAAGGNNWTEDGAHGLALRRDGTVTGWGYNYYGQTTPPPGLSGVVAISAGRDHSLALRPDGTVVAWGQNLFDQTGVPENLHNVVEISAGGFQSFALQSNGTVVGWGRYFDGAAWVPTFVPDGLVDVISIAAGRFHCLALRRDGTVVAWGNGLLGQTRVPAGLSGVVALATGGFHSLALKADGSVVGWGLNDYGQSTPPGPALQNVRLIAAGMQFSIAVCAEPGSPEITSSREISAAVGAPLEFPVTVVNAVPLAFSATGLPPGITLHPTTGVISGTFAAPARAVIRIVVETDKGRLIQSASIAGTAGAVPLGIDLNPAEVMENALDGTWVGDFWINDPDGAGGNSLDLVSGEGSDDNDRFTIEYGQLRVRGRIDRDFESQPGPLSIRVRTTDPDLNHFERKFLLTFLDDGSEDADRDGLSQAQEAAYGTSDFQIDSDGDGFGDGFEASRFTLPIDPDSRPDGCLVVAWGGNSSGLPGAPIPPGEVAELDAGRNHSLAVRIDGSVIAWGSNEFGQCQVPPGLTDSVAVAAGGRHSLALAAGGTVTAWGGNESGQCNVPAGLADVIAISAGESHSLALVADGTVVAWGGNQFGQSSVPPMQAGVIAISAGGVHSLALMENGKVRAWGSDWNGICSVPADLREVVGISAGGYHNLAVKADGSVSSWGYSSDGQTSVPQNLSGVVQVAAGWFHSLALRSNGSVSAWGDGRDGATAVPIEAVAVRRISAGGSRSLALRHDRPLAEISANSRVRASVGTAVAQPVIVTGATPLAFRALGLPVDLSLDSPTGLQEGMIETGEIRSVLLIVESDQGRLQRILPYNTLDGVPPTAIQLDPPSVVEHSPPGSFVGTLTATDPDVGDTHVFSLVAGAGDRDNYRFLVDGNGLTVRYGIDVDYEAAHADFSIRVRAVDAALNEPIEQVLRIRLANDWSEDPDGDGLSQAADALVAWAGAGGLTGDNRLPAASPWGDGVSNLVKYAFGLDPAAPYRPSAGLPVLVFAPPAADGSFQYVRRKDRGLIYQPQSTWSLASDAFVELLEPHQVISIDANWERVIHHLAGQPSGAARRFFRVKIILP